MHAHALAALAEQLGIARRVSFAGEADAATLEALWQGADMFALATHWEGYGMAIAEALKRGMPVAVTAGGAAGALVTPRSGVVCAPGDEATLSKALRRLIFDLPLRARSPRPRGPRDANCRTGRRRHAHSRRRLKHEKGRKARALPWTRQGPGGAWTPLLGACFRPVPLLPVTAPLLGCIADDFTGATDLASMLVRNGMRTVQLIGVPAMPTTPCRTPTRRGGAEVAHRAGARGGAAKASPRSTGCARAGCRQFFFKYCSTFDSTDAGNIGPVGDALIAALGCGFALACPAFPANGRSVYQGHLFVGTALLNESGMENHPLTPMTRRQPGARAGAADRRHGRAGAVRHGRAGRRRRSARAMTALKEQGRRYAIVDAVTDAHLHAIGEAAARARADHRRIGRRDGLPENFRRAGLLPLRDRSRRAAALSQGHAAVLAGSCSRATLMQIGRAREHAAGAGTRSAGDAGCRRAGPSGARNGRRTRSGTTPIVIAASAPPERVAALQARLGRDAAGALVEQALAGIAEALVARGVRRLVVAGGETSGAVVTRLGVRSLRIGAEIDPGVPWTYAEGDGRAAAAGAEERQFRRARFLPEGVRQVLGRNGA